MSHEVIMPQMGESIAEGTITTWLKKVGETVERDEPLFEISTDKVDAEIPSPVAGTLLEIKVEPGSTVPINTVVAVIGEEGESVSEASASSAQASKGSEKAESGEADAEKAERGETGAEKAESSEADAEKAKASEHDAEKAKSSEADAEKAKSSEARGGKAGAEASVEERRRTRSSPVVRKIAAEHDVDITRIEGTGISGRVTKQDILAHLESGEAPPAPDRASGEAPARTLAAGPMEIPAAYRPQVFEGDRVEELSVMRQKIAEHMVLSRRISSHVQTVFEVDFSHVDKLRRKHKARWDEQHGVKLTYTHFVMKAAVDALKAHPIVNASLDGDRAIYHRDVNLGLAVALDWGLIVPVVHKANELNLLGLARRANDLARRARDKKLKPDEVQRGTFTITNPGVFGNLFGLPVINQPQVAILGMGGIEKRPVVIDDAIAIRTRAYMSLSFDHRLVDGAVADQFMGRLKQGIQEFDEAEL